MAKSSKKPEIPSVDTVLYANGQTSEARPNNGKGYQLKELYSMLGCRMVEVVQTQIPGIIVICDEEGLFVENPVRNVQASNMAGRPIVGNALACHTSRFK